MGSFASREEVVHLSNGRATVQTSILLGDAVTLGDAKQLGSPGNSVIKDGDGVLHHITVNDNVLATITVYDNTAGSGDKIATIAATSDRKTYHYNVKFKKGLTVNTSEAVDITIAYT